MTFVEQYGNIGWKAHELASNLFESEFGFVKSSY